MMSKLLSLLDEYEYEFDQYAIDIITDTDKRIKELGAQLDRVRELPDEWLIQITDTDDEKLGIRFCAHELQQALEQDNE